MTARKRKKPPLSELIGHVVVIVWLDSGMDIKSSTQDPSEFDLNADSRTLGILVRYDKKITVLCNHTNSDSKEKGYVVIYTPCIEDYEIPE